MTPQRLHAEPEPYLLIELGEDIVRPSWRHEEHGRNDHAPLVKRSNKVEQGTATGRWSWIHSKLDTAGYLPDGSMFVTSYESQTGNGAYPFCAPDRGESLVDRPGKAGMSKAGNSFI